MHRPISVGESHPASGAERARAGSQDEGVGAAKPVCRPPGAARRLWEAPSAQAREVQVFNARGVRKALALISADFEDTFYGPLWPLRRGLLFCAKRGS